MNKTTLSILCGAALAGATLGASAHEPGKGGPHNNMRAEAAAHKAKHAQQQQARHQARQHHAEGSQAENHQPGRHHGEGHGRR